MVAARGGARSLGLALLLASPGSLRCPPRSPACRSVCEGGGGRRGGGGRPSGPRETRGRRRRLRGTPGSHGRREVAGGAERWGLLPPLPSSQSSRPSPFSFCGGGLRGPGPGWEEAPFTSSPPPPTSPGAGRPVGSSLPPRSGLCVGRRRLGWGRGAGKPSLGPRPLSYSPSPGRGPSAPSQASFVLHQAPARRTSWGERK